MEKFKIVYGSSRECEKQLDQLNEKHWIAVLGFSVNNENITILVTITERT